MPTNIIPKTFMKNVYYNIQDIQDNISEKKFYDDNIFEQFQNVNQITLFFLMEIACRTNIL